jgi:signal transduction histidine kinase
MVNFLNIKSDSEKISDPVSYWRLVLLKTILLLFVGTFSAVYGLSFVRENSILGGGTTHFVFISCLIVFSTLYLVINQISRLKIGAIILTVFFVLIGVCVPYIHPTGYQAPFFQNYPILLFIVYLLTGLKGALITGAILEFFLIGQVTGYFSSLGYSLVTERNDLYYELYRVRIIGLITSLFLIYIFENIARSINEQLATQRSKAEKADKYEVLAKVAEGFAHEINNPLAIASGHSWQLKRVASDSEFEEKLVHIEHAHERISKLVRRFLAIFATKKVKLKPVNIDSVMAYSLKHLGLDKSISAVDDTLNVNSNPLILNELISIITENAIEATNDVPGGEIKWVVSDKNMLLCVDNGLGFNKLNFDDCVKPFVTTKSLRSGVGIGLFKGNLLCEKVDASLFHYRKDFKTYVGIKFNTNFYSEKKKKLA